MPGVLSCLYQWIGPPRTRPPALLPPPKPHSKSEFAPAQLTHPLLRPTTVPNAIITSYFSQVTCKFPRLPGAISLIPYTTLKQEGGVNLGGKRERKRRFRAPHGYRASPRYIVSMLLSPHDGRSRKRGRGVVNLGGKRGENADFRAPHGYRASPRYTRSMLLNLHDRRLGRGGVPT